MSGGVSISMASSCGTVEHAPYTDLQANGSVEIPVRVKVDSNAPEGRCKVSATLSWYNTNFQKVDTTANAEFDVLEKPRIEVPGGTTTISTETDKAYLDLSIKVSQDWTGSLTLELDLIRGPDGNTYAGSYRVEDSEGKPLTKNQSGDPAGRVGRESLRLRYEGPVTGYLVLDGFKDQPAGTYELELWVEGSDLKPTKAKFKVIKK